MKKAFALCPQLILLVWFFFDMTGLYFGNNCLVTRSYKDDGIFFLIYLASVIVFIVSERTGRWLSVIWLSMWFITQFLCHEWYTIFDSGFMGDIAGKTEYFSGTMQWLTIDGKYIPDIYHTVLHILILYALTATVIYIIKSRNKMARHKNS